MLKVTTPCFHAADQFRNEQWTTVKSAEYVGRLVARLSLNAGTRLLP
jgi:hypothetical protein